MNSIRQENKLKTRIKIVKIAEQMFMQSYFLANTVDIAKKCGIAHGTIFFHFKSRDELVYEVVKSLILKITDQLYDAVDTAENLNEFLSTHLKIIKKEWPLYKALVIGYSCFSPEIKKEVIGLLSGINIHLIDAFKKWGVKGLPRTVLWQGALVYLSMFGDFMFDQKKISPKFYQELIDIVSKQ